MGNAPVQEKSSAAPETETGLDPKRASNSARETGATKFDATAAAKLVLRNADAAATGALDRTGDARIASLAIAANTLATAYREVAQLTKMAPVHFEEIAGVLAAVMKRTDAIRSELAGKGVDAVVGDLESARQSMAASMPSGLRLPDPGGEAATARPLSTLESAQLAQQAILAASEGVRRFLAARGADVNDDALAICGVLPLHLEVARDAAMSIADRRARLSLGAVVERLSGELDQLAELLSMKPKLSWNPAFARTFDAENQLRAALGLVGRARPYTGTIDPEAAGKTVISAGSGKMNADSVQYEDPASAIAGIGAAMHSMFESRQTAVEDLGINLKEPPLPPEESWTETLLWFGVKVAISAVTAGLADGLAERMASRFEAKDIGRLGDAVKHLSESEREMVEQQLKSLPHAGRALAIHATKEGLTLLLKDSSIKALEERNKPEPFATHPITAFVQRQRLVLIGIEKNAAELFAKLGSALAQLDLSILTSLAETFSRDLAGEAYNRQYRSSMAAWENMQAEAELRSPRSAADARNEAMVRTQGVKGVLEAIVDVDPDPKLDAIQLTRLVLNGGEPAAVRYYRKQSLHVQDVGLHVLYRVRMSDLRDFGAVTFSVATDGRLQRESLSERDLRTLKIYASGDRVRGANFWAAAEGDYDRLPDSAGVHIAHHIAHRIGQHTTADLEEGK